MPDLRWTVGRVGHRSPYTALCRVCKVEYTGTDKYAMVDRIRSHVIEEHGAQEDPAVDTFRGRAG